mgnify:CR=1 FL=1
MFRIFAVTMLVVGTIIGAGFASGREIVTFFGETPPAAVAVVVAVLVSVSCATFLFVGRKAHADDIGTVNRKIAGRAEPILSALMLFNSLVSLSAMLAGTDDLFGDIFPLKPLYSIIFGTLSVIVVARGLDGIMKVNVVVVPLLAAITVLVTSLTISSPSFSHFTAITAYKSLTYVAMNAILAASVLTTVHGLNRKQIVISSALTGVIIGGIVLCIILALGSSGAGKADMPIIEMAKPLGTVLYSLGVASVAIGIFTTLISAHLSLTEWAVSLCGNKTFTAILTAIVAEIIGLIGFRTVVDVFYPIVGVAGVVYFIACLIYVLSRKTAKTLPLPHSENNPIKRRRDAKTI